MLPQATIAFAYAYCQSQLHRRQKERSHMRYEFATAQRIIVGPGSSTDLADSVRALGARALLVLGRGMAGRGGPAAALAARLAELGLVAASYLVAGEPQIIDVEEGAGLARASGCDLVIGIGG